MGPVVYAVRRWPKRRYAAHGCVAVISAANLNVRACKMRLELGARCGAVGWGTALHAGRSRVRFPMVSLEFFIDVIIPVASVDRLSL